MKTKKMKLNQILLDAKDMKHLKGGNGNGYHCGCGCGELSNGYTNAAGSTQENYDDDFPPPDDK